MRVAIVGGKLQGIEAAFLAHEAGWEVVLIDKKPNVPASGLCQSFYQYDVTEESLSLLQALQEVDLIIAALEDVTALRALQKCTSAVNVPLAYDARAFYITHSKKRSNQLLEKCSIPLPQSWPRCGPPLIAKPSSSSGSQGVSKICTWQELGDFIERIGPSLEHWILQEYLEGPSYSVEVMGLAGHYITLQVTELEMDNHYDCKRVLAPATISEPLDRQIREIALTIAKSLHLTGIMDVEVILHQGIPKVLEIDARLPSQTPTAVYKSTGINMLELLADIFIRDTLPVIPEIKALRWVVYEHIKVHPDSIEILGEHIMGEVDRLELVPNFFGADVGLTNFSLLPFPWVATLITSGGNREQAWLKHERIINNVRGYLE